MSLLEVRDLETHFYTEEGVVRAVDGVSYSIERGERFAVVGESGAGKSVTSLSLLGLIDSPGRIVGGEILFEGENVLEMDEDRLRELRGNQIAMIFQDPGAALDPVYTVGEQIAEAIRAHTDLSEFEIEDRVVDLLDRVGIPDPEHRRTDYPHEFSGGMQQRAMIAQALSCDPDLIIADEPTTGLDVTIQAQILDLLEELSEETDTAVQLITHNLGVVAGLCDRVMVMYAGEVVERAPVQELYYDPRHPYTVGLMASIPKIGDDRDRLDAIPGRMPDLVDPPSGCRFHPRCPYAEEACERIEPALVEATTGEPVDDRDGDVHAAACLAYTGDLAGELDYEVTVEDEAVGDGGPLTGDPGGDGRDPNAIEDDLEDEPIGDAPTTNGGDRG